MSLGVDGGFLAGMVAGEGSFYIHPNNAGQSWCCAFSLKLRADDTPLVRALQEAASCGTLYPVRSQGNSKPQTAWVVNRRDDCRQLCRVLDESPLLAKKAGEFQIWKEAVDRWFSLDSGRYAAMAGLAQQISAHRRVEFKPTYWPVDIDHHYVDRFSAGFATAEGHFGVSFPSGHPSFRINLRHDDRAVLEFLTRRYRLGRLATAREHGRVSGVAFWVVSRLDDVRRLVEVFDRNPPLGRKSEHYLAWRELVLFIDRARHRPRRPGDARWRRELAMRVRVSRAYRSQAPVSSPDRAPERRARCIAALQRCAALLQRPLTATAYEQVRRDSESRWPSRNTIARTFGSWRLALEAAGLPTTHSTNARVIASAAKTAAPAREARRKQNRGLIAATISSSRAEMGDWPTASQFFAWRIVAAPHSRSHMTLYRVFPGGWAEALEAAKAHALAQTT